MLLILPFSSVSFPRDTLWAVVFPWIWVTPETAVMNTGEDGHGIIRSRGEDGGLNKSGQAIVTPWFGSML